MKNLGLFTLTILVLGGLSWFGMAWWWLAVAGFVAGFLFKNSRKAVFGLGFAAGTLLWGILAFYFNYLNTGNLGGKMGSLLQGITTANLLWATGILGGLLAGMGALTGNLARRIFQKEPEN